MKMVKFALVISVLGVACAESAAQQPKIFDWRPANDETVRMDPANYYTAQTYRPAISGGGHPRGHNRGEARDSLYD